MAVCDDGSGSASRAAIRLVMLGRLEQDYSCRQMPLSKILEVDQQFERRPRIPRLPLELLVEGIDCVV